MITPEQLREALHDIGIDLYGWQEEVIWDREHKKILMNCGRKVSKTTCVEIRHAMRLLNDDIPASGIRGGMAITGDEQEGGKLILQGVADILSMFGWDFSNDRAKKSADKQIAFMKVNEIQMPNGNRDLSLTSKWSGRTMRKYSFYEIAVDEADFINNEFYAAIRYCLARFDGTELLESTPNLLGDRNTYFAKGFFGVNEGYKIYHIPTTQVAHISKEWLEKERKTKSPREYDREIMAEFVSDISCVFPNAVINDCFQEDIEWDAETAFIGAKYASFDTQSSVIAENFLKDGISHIRIGIIPQYGRRIMEVENHIVSMINSNGAIRRIVIDNTSLGITPVESMAALVGEDMVVGVQNHETIREIEGGRRRYMKEDLYVNLLKLMERRQVKFNDRRIVDALMDVKYEYSRKSKQIYIIGNDAVDAIVRAVFPVWGRREWLGPIPKAFFFQKL